MALPIPEQDPQTSSAPVLAHPGDPKGFSPRYQEQLNTRIVEGHVTDILGPIPIQTIPTPTSTGQEQAHTTADTNDGIITHIAKNLVTTDMLSAKERMAAARRRRLDEGY